MIWSISGRWEGVNTVNSRAGLCTLSMHGSTAAGGVICNYNNNNSIHNTCDCSARFWYISSITCDPDIMTTHFMLTKCAGTGSKHWCGSYSDSSTVVFVKNFFFIFILCLFVCVRVCWLQGKVVENLIMYSQYLSHTARTYM